MVKRIRGVVEQIKELGPGVEGVGTVGRRVCADFTGRIPILERIILSQYLKFAVRTLKMGRAGGLMIRTAASNTKWLNPGHRQTEEHFFAICLA